MAKATDRKKAKVKEVLGSVTGDRQVEAAGIAERRTTEPSARQIESEERRVRVRHGDMHDPSGDNERGRT